MTTATDIHRPFNPLKNGPGARGRQYGSWRDSRTGRQPTETNGVPGSDHSVGHGNGAEGEPPTRRGGLSSNNRTNQTKPTCGRSVGGSLRTGLLSPVLITASGSTFLKSDQATGPLLLGPCYPAKTARGHRFRLGCHGHLACFSGALNTSSGSTFTFKPACVTDFLNPVVCGRILTRPSRGMVSEEASERGCYSAMKHPGGLTLKSTYNSNQRLKLWKTNAH